MKAAPLLALLTPLAALILGPVGAVAIFGVEAIAETFQIGGFYTYLILLAAFASTAGAAVLAYFSAKNTISGAFAPAVALFPWLVGLGGMQLAVLQVRSALDLVEPTMAQALMMAGASEAMVPRMIGAGLSAFLLFLTGAGLFTSALLSRNSGSGGLSGNIGWSGICALVMAGFALGTCVLLSFDRSLLELLGRRAAGDPVLFISAPQGLPELVKTMILAAIAATLIAAIAGFFVKPIRRAGAATLLAAALLVMLLERSSDRSLSAMAAALRRPWSPIAGFAPIELFAEKRVHPTGALAQDGLHLPLHAPPIALDDRTKVAAAFTHLREQYPDTPSIALDRRAGGAALHGLIAGAAAAGVDRLFFSGQTPELDPPLAGATLAAPRIGVLPPETASIETFLPAAIGDAAPRFRGRLTAGDQLLLNAENSPPITVQLGKTPQIAGDGEIAAITIGRDADATRLVRALQTLQRAKLKVVLQPE